MRARSLGIALWTPVFTLASGCSFIFTNGPPKGHEQMAYFDCPSDRAAPASDVGYALITGVTTLALAADDDDPYETDDDQTPATVVFGTLGALSVASAIYGLVKTGECQEAKQQLAERIWTAREREAERRAHPEPRMPQGSHAPQAPAAAPAGEPDKGSSPGAPASPSAEPAQKAPVSAPP